MTSSHCTYTITKFICTLTKETFRRKYSFGNYCQQHGSGIKHSSSVFAPRPPVSYFSQQEIYIDAPLSPEPPYWFSDSPVSGNLCKTKTAERGYNTVATLRFRAFIPKPAAVKPTGKRSGGGERDPVSRGIQSCVYKKSHPYSTPFAPLTNIL